MRKKIQYEPDTRAGAMKDGKGLYTIEFVYAGKNGAPPSGGITLQGPMGKEDYEEIFAFMIKWMKNRKQRQGK